MLGALEGEIRDQLAAAGEERETLLRRMQESFSSSLQLGTAAGTWYVSQQGGLKSDEGNLS